MREVYCSYCDKETKGELAQFEEILKVRGEEVKIASSAMKCKDCGRFVFDEEIETKNLEFAYSEYRKRHNLIGPSEIKEIREKYGLSQRAFSRLLGWGEITLHRYESGALQDEAHNTVLSLVSNPENMQKILEKNLSLLSSTEAEKLKTRVQDLLTGEIEPKFNLALEEILSKGMSDLTGFLKFNLEKTKNIILYILEFHSTFATKINKLLWYMEFLYFKKYSVSIAGNCYLHRPYGPVPNGYDLILGAMINEGIIEKEEVFLHKEIQEQLKVKANYDKKIFSKEEMQIMNFVLETFKDYSCTKISQYSHEEIPYKNTSEGEEISYNLAEKLSLSA
jgi:putative zinc finger/helix-turn-helix YgiT family protein